MHQRTLVALASVTLLAASFAALTPRSGRAAELKLKPGDRIVFLGDSITAAGVGEKGYVTLVGKAIAEHHGDLGVEILGAGISGHKVPDCQKRLERDVLAKKPTIVVIYIGINDVWHWNRNAGTTKEDFESGLIDLVKRCQAAEARVILCTPSVIGEKTDGSNQFDEMLAEYAEISRQVTKRTDCQLLDLRCRFLDYLKEHNKENQEKNVLTTDGVHLNKAGNRFVADCVLEALGVGADNHDRLLRHVVLFKFKDDTSPEQLKKAVEAFADLPNKIDAIVDFEYGTDVSVEGKADGFTHCFLVTFKNEEGRATYLPHPAHQELVKLVGPHLDKVLVIDYWTHH
jgi:lysophospholipase L1-like esterase